MVLQDHFRPPLSERRQWHCPAQRTAFVSKCAAYLQQGVGLIIVDVVTERRANLHHDLLRRVQALEESASNRQELSAELYAVAYRPILRADQPSLDLWDEALAIGSSLPILPLWLHGNLCVPVNLEETYRRTCLEQRIVLSPPIG